MAEQGIPEAIACDGKTVRGSCSASTKPRHLVSAVIHGTTRMIAHTGVDEKSNEMPAIHTLLDSLDVIGTSITADAMHTQRHLYGREETGGLPLDCKGNQPTLEQAIGTLSSEDFSPSGRNVGQRTRPSETSSPPSQYRPQ